ncbi:MAG: GNAT family N-acetyltransferase [Methylocella sp.]
MDAVHLAGMPAALDGVPHPLQHLFNMQGPNRSYRMGLPAEYDLLLAGKRSAETRSRYRQRERALAALGDLRFGLPSGREETHATLALMFEQQEQRLGERGVHGVFGPVERDFLHRLADLQDETNPVLLPYTLKLKGEVLAVMLGGFHANTYWALISSLSAANLHKYSPGDLALRRTIEASCARGLASYDFAAGDTDYKLHWADEVIALQTLLAASNLRGLVWACVMGAATLAKRLLKQSPTVRNAAMLLRKALLGRQFRRSPRQG